MSGTNVCDYCFREPLGGIAWHEYEAIPVNKPGMISAYRKATIKHASCPRCIPHAPEAARAEWFKHMGEAAKNLEAHYRATGVWQ